MVWVPQSTVSFLGIDYTNSGSFIGYDWGLWTDSGYWTSADDNSSAANNGMLFAGVLPPGMDGALQAAKQAAKGLPKTTPGPNLSPGKWRPPQSIEDLLNDASKAIKYVLDNIDFPGSGDFLFVIDPSLTSPNLRCGPYAPPQS
jgi:hypothetical protein